MPNEQTTPTWMIPSTDGVEIAAYDLGGSGDLLLISHATGLCGPMYRRFAELLTKRFRVVTWDFRAHGRSTSPTNDDLRWGRMATDVLAVIDVVNEPDSTNRVFAFGHSMGGAALLLAVCDRPDLFSAIYLYEPIVFPEHTLPPSQNFMANLARKRRATFASRADAFARFASRPPFDAVRAGFLADYIEHGFHDIDGGVNLSCAPDHEARTFEGAIDSHLGLYATIETPTLIAAGHFDEGPNPARFAEPLAAALPHATLKLYPELSHFGPFEDPARVAADLIAFVNGVTVADPTVA